MKSAIRAAFALSLAAASASASAEVFYDKRPYFAPAVTYTFAEDDRGADNPIGFYVGGGKALTRWWNAEFGVFGSKFDSELNGRQLWSELGFKLDGQFFYSRERAFSPYAGIGVGVQRNELKATGTRDTGPMVDAGFGFISWLDVSGYDLGLRADARYRYAFLDEIDQVTGGAVDEFNEPIIKLGLVLPLGPKAAAAGVAAAGAATTASSANQDSDGDGVPDSLDRCPGTPKGVAVDSTGCPRDVGAAATSGLRQFDDVLFPFDSSEITPAGARILDNAAEVVNSGGYKGVKVNISGHTDAIGSEGYNQALSERRANAVRSYLVKKGVDASRIHTFAYGESSPKADNENEEGRSLNRRAEVKAGE